MTDLGRQWTLLVVLSAFLLSVLVLGQIVARYTSAYRSAPTEVSAFLDTLDSSVEENESYDRDLSRVPRLEDKLRLGRLLRDIQKAGDDLREHLNRLLLLPDHDGLVPRVEDFDPTAAADPRRSDNLDNASPAPRLRVSARLLWAACRAELSERVRRLDLLRMRFLVVYMSIVAATTAAAADRAEKTTASSPTPRLNEKSASLGPSPGPESNNSHPDIGPDASPEQTPPRALARTMTSYSEPQLPEGGAQQFPALGVSIREAIKRRPPLRRLTTQAMGHHTETIDEDGSQGGGGAHRRGWAGVVQELQRSPLMHKRHMSIENAMARSMTPP